MMIRPTLPPRILSPFLGGDRLDIFYIHTHIDRGRRASGIRATSALSAGWAGVS